MYVGDLMADLLKLLLYVTVMVVSVLLARLHVLERDRRWPRASIYSLALFATLGMMVMISANHFW
jgi:NADH-quinone oxidoreductase subunit N